MIREKNNPKYRFISWGYHIVLTVIVFAINPWYSLIFVPSVIRAIMLYGKKISILKVGILEIVTCIFFNNNGNNDEVCHLKKLPIF